MNLGENRSCKAYEERLDIEPDVFSGRVQVNCANYKRWNGERCKDESMVVNSQDTELVDSLAWCQW